MSLQNRSEVRAPSGGAVSGIAPGSPSGGAVPVGSCGACSFPSFGSRALAAELLACDRVVTVSAFGSSESKTPRACCSSSAVRECRMCSTSEASVPNRTSSGNRIDSSLSYILPSVEFYRHHRSGINSTPFHVPHSHSPSRHLGLGHEALMH